MAEQQDKSKVIKLPDRKSFTPRSKERSNLDTVAYLAHKYPQYTIQQLYEEVPQKWFPAMIRAVKRDEAEKLLLLNNIINGPNEKGKSKSTYKKTIDILKKMME